MTRITSDVKVKPTLRLLLSDARVFARCTCEGIEREGFDRQSMTDMDACWSLYVLPEVRARFNGTPSGWEPYLEAAREVFENEYGEE